MIDDVDHDLERRPMSRDILDSYLRGKRRMLVELVAGRAARRRLRVPSMC